MEGVYLHQQRHAPASARTIPHLAAKARTVVEPRREAPFGRGFTSFGFFPQGFPKAGLLDRQVVVGGGTLAFGAPMRTRGVFPLAEGQDWDRSLRTPKGL